VLRGGFSRTNELQELGAWLGSAGDARPALTSAVARTLGDDTIRVLFRMAEREAFVDANGVPTELPAKDSGRGAATIELDGRLVGAIEYDSVLIADARLVHNAGRVVAIAVDRQRLTAELLASERELRRSRSRLIQAAELERRRIARDLHDGLQVQLVLLALQAGQLSHAADVTDEYRHGAITLRQGIDSAAAGLREFVHGVMPSTLIEHGLPAAAEDLVDRMPVPTTLELGIGDDSLPQVIESAAYFVLAEGLANTLKHSRATACAVRLNRTVDRLYIDVHDNGVGGASFENGAGLSGLSDRIDALGGELRIDSSPDNGTRLYVELPCGS
jgi:signal transduction histidine kinase